MLKRDTYLEKMTSLGTKENNYDKDGQLWAFLWFFVFLEFLVRLEFGTQDFMLAKQALYCLSHICSPKTPILKGASRPILCLQGCSDIYVIMTQI
jgi:hypothetical protein